MKHLLIAAMLMAAVGSAACAKPAGAKPAPLLTPGDLDAALVLPPPPLPGSMQANAELAEFRAIESSRTAAERDAAARDGETKNATIFAETLGPRFDLDRLPETGALLAIVRDTEKSIVDHAKGEFRRPRPWIVDDRLKTCKRSEDPLSSYPSGHTSMAFSMGQILARLVPEKAGEILKRAALYGQSRIVCEQHFRSDVTAGQALGTLIAERLMSKPAFIDAFARARSELIAAKVAVPRR